MFVLSEILKYSKGKPHTTIHISHWGNRLEMEFGYTNDVQFMNNIHL